MEQDLKDYDLKSGIESELLSRYRIGGFHPVSIGDSLCDGRYHISFKLGFGSFSTDWLALDTHHNRLVNIKILLADFGEQSHEETVLRALSQSDKQHPGRQHVSTLLDTFSHTGRNGVHRCLVFKVMNLTLGQQCQRDARLRAEAAWSVSKQVAQALQYIHSQGFIHGDVHSGNVMLASHPKGLSELSLLDSLPTLQETPYSSSGRTMSQSLPSLVVENTDMPPLTSGPQSWHAEVIDFGQAFPIGALPSRIVTPLPDQAPELIFDAEMNQAADVWSFACMTFLLVTETQAFCHIPTKQRLVRDWVAAFGELPSEWRNHPDAKVELSETKSRSIAAWLHECYFLDWDEDEEELGVIPGNEDELFGGNIKAQENVPEFSEQDIQCLGELLTMMMRYRPEERPTMSQVLAHRWFTKNPFE